MVRTVCALALVFLPLLLFGQNPPLHDEKLQSVEYYFKLYCQSDGTLAPPLNDLETFIRKLEQKKPAFKTQKAFVYHLFDKAHQDYFLRYEEYASFNDLATHGIYNCLTGTALLGILLEYFDLDYSIVETNYHAFLLVSNNTILLETTDRNGFIDNSNEIQDRILKYKRLTVDKKLASKEYFQYDNTSLDSVTRVGMLGLLHYNQAVKAYNEQQLKLSISHLQHALLLRRSLKIEVFLELMIQTVSVSGYINEETRKQYLEKLTAMRRATVATETPLLPVVSP